MKAFVFRAETVLRLRRRSDEQAQQALALAEQRTRQAEEALLTAERAVSDQCARSAQADRAAQTLDLAIWYRNWIQKLRHDVEWKRRLLRERRIEADDARVRAQDAHRKLRAIEKLKERLLSAHGALERAAEQQALDELGSQQYVNRRLGGHLEH